MKNKKPGKTLEEKNNPTDWVITEGNRNRQGVLSQPVGSVLELQTQSCKKENFQSQVRGDAPASRRIIGSLRAFADMGVKKKGKKNPSK